MAKKIKLYYKAKRMCFIGTFPYVIPDEKTEKVWHYFRFEK